MLKKRLTVLFVLFLIAIMVLPIATAYAGVQTNYYSFYMSNRYVNGWSNGQTYTLVAGTAKLSGDASLIWRPGAPDEHEDSIGYTLYKHGFLWSTKYGYIEGPIEGSFSGTFGTVPAGSNYYLVIELTFADGWDHSGSGTIKVYY